jgi:hypothetical protein
MEEHFKKACEKLGIAPVLPDVSMMPEKHRKSFIAYLMLVILTEALNDGWKYDPAAGEYGYFPVFYYGADGGFAYLLSDDAASYTDASIGARLCYKSRSLAVYSANEFFELWSDYLSNKDL